jgi:hypothetical protein
LSSFRKIHERIGRVLEHLFGDRLCEYYEALAYHINKPEKKQRFIK